MPSNTNSPAQSPNLHPISSPLYLIDGHSLTFKAYFGIRSRLTSPSGMPTGAVYGFLRMLLRVIEDQRAAYLAVVFDTGKPTFRSEIYTAYKANRESPPADFGDQMDAILELLKAMGIPVYFLDGYEADDLIGTMATQMAAFGNETIVASADKDLFQLINDRVKMLRFGFKDVELYEAPQVVKKIGVRPDQVVDWLSLVGDSSDNIPGAPGIGEKTASKLLQDYGTLDAVLAKAQEIEPTRVRNSLLSHEAQIRTSHELATIHRSVPFEWNLESCRLPETLWNPESVGLLMSLGFDSIIREKNLQKPTAPARMNVSQIEKNYRAIYDLSELKAWVDEARKADWLAYDTETDTVDPMRANVVGISMSFRAGEAIYIPVGHRIGDRVDSQLSLHSLHPVLNPLFGESDGPRVSAHNAKFDLKVMKRAGFTMRDPDFDTMVASFVLDPGRDSGQGLKALASQFCNLPMSLISDIIGSGKKQITMAEVPADDVFEYACCDADATLRLTECFRAALAKVPSLEKLFYEIEMPLVPVLNRIEMGGFAVDKSMLLEMGSSMNREIMRLAKEIWASAGCQFNIDSPKQVAQVLFEDLKLPTKKKTKTGYSTDTEVLESLASQHHVVSLILEYRALTKLKSTYADALPHEIHPETGRIHTSFNQTIAQTGRLSSNNPNLQNIPIRTAMGREIRRAFIPDQPDHMLLSADYSQIELRILTHLCGDEALRDAYAHERDIHALTASRVFGVSESDVTSEMRSKAKMVNFGIIYGISAHGLSQRLGISRGEAAEIIDAYFRGYPKVREWIDATLEQARKDEYVETLCGRRRHLPDINAKNGMLRANAERIAVNTPIQGASADMIKIAMINVDAGLEAAAPGCRMLCQVHDELLFSVPQDQQAQASAFVRKTMTEALPLDVPIVVDLAVAQNWSEC